MSAYAEWRAYIKATVGDEIGDDELMAMVSSIVQQATEDENRHTAATIAHIEAERLPAGVSSIAKKRAEGTGWDKAKTMASSPFLQLNIPDELTERINRLAASDGKSFGEVLSTAVARGVNALERDKGPSQGR